MTANYTCSCGLPEGVHAPGCAVCAKEIADRDEREATEVCRCAACGEPINAHAEDCPVLASSEFLDGTASVSSDASKFRYLPARKDRHIFERKEMDDPPPQGATGKPHQSTKPDIPEGSPCRQALGMVYGERERDYGHPSQNFDRIRALWNAYLRGKGYDVNLTRRDIGLLNILQKCARDQHAPIPDNLNDICGYAEAIFRAEGGS